MSAKKEFRKEAIKEYIIKNSEVSVSQLCELFPNLSAMTIRRDLAKLEDERAIIRTHGGARTNPSSIGVLEAVYAERENEAIKEKEFIGASASQLISERKTIFIDSGTTAMELARRLPDINLTIITSAPNIAIELAYRKPNCNVLVAGGKLNIKSLTCSGHGAIEFIKDINIETAFMCTSGFSTATGFTVGDFHECELKKFVINKAQKVIMLMDTSKTGKTMPFTFAKPKDIDVLVVDKFLPSDLLKFFINSNIKIIKE